MKRDESHALVKLGWLFATYLCCSFVVFLLLSNTLLGGIIYIFFLLPFYGVTLLWVAYFVWCHRTQRARVQWWIWGIILALQIATMLASPGNCYGVKQGDRCYSNLQILVGSAASTGPNQVPHWTVIEDSFPGLVMAYGAALIVGLAKVSITDK
jgi:hypothetical protein